MTLAVDRFGKDKGADFIGLVAWGKSAELAEKYLTKGRQVLVEGQIRTGSYEKDGQKRYTTDIYVDRIEFVGGGGKQEKPQEDVTVFSPTDDDIPF